MRRTAPLRAVQTGLTLVELMVALVLGLLIAGASIAALIIARQGYGSVDSSTQLRENARFAASVMQRIAVEAGFENVTYDGEEGVKPPGLRGYDNAVLPADLTTLPGALAHGSRPAACGAVTDTSCINGSDVMVVRFWGASHNGTADASMINCAGIPEPRAASGEENRAFSIFHVARNSSGEPTLACTYRDPTTLAWTTVPLVQGVEGLQVLYGVDGVTPGMASVDVSTGADMVADRYLRASQLDAAVGFVENNWSRVRSVRIGLLVRGEPGSALQKTATSFNVLGDGFGANEDVGATLNAPADGRLRYGLVFTVHLRNAQSQ